MANNGRRRGRPRPQPRRVFGGRWQVIAELGSGGQGTAYLVRDITVENTDAEHVLKELRTRMRGERSEWQQKRLDRFEREIAALNRLDLSPNIPSVVDSCVDSERAYFVTPYAGKNFEKVSNLVEPYAILQRFRGLVEAAKYANDREIVHRDIKPNNATVRDDGTPCLVDFGICMYDEEMGLTDTWEGFGNRYFAAPECDAGNPEPIGPPADIYSLGKVLHWMATDRGKMGREDFDEDALVFTNRTARQYFIVILRHTVCEDWRARWSASELLDYIDWALAKLDEHAMIAASGLLVLKDNFGPSESCNENGSLSATTGSGGPSADYDIADSFFVGDAVALNELGIRLARSRGSGEVEIALIRGGIELPSDDPNDLVAKWTRNLTAPRSALEVLTLVPESDVMLGPQEAYWIRIAACSVDSAVEWMAAAEGLRPQLARSADRVRGSAWRPRVSIQGPGMGFRVIGRTS